LPERFGYALKCRLLGPPLVNDRLRVERLSKPLGLGVLSCDGISSANYGSELILHELLPFFGLAAFTLLLPMTGLILAGVAFVVLSYREVVSVYTRAGGSYVVARENFGPRVAQVAAVALMVDYVVTVAVQTAAGSQAILSTFPVVARPLGGTTTLLLIAVTATLIMCYVNLLGVRENGKTFAIPTYLFSGSVGLMIIVGFGREFFGGGLPHAHWQHGTVAVGHHAGLLTFAAIYIIGRAFANGGSSLTGIDRDRAGARDHGQACRAQFHPGLHDHRPRRRTDRAVLRAHAHTRHRTWHQPAAARPSNSQQHRTDHDQPRLRTNRHGILAPLGRAERMSVTRQRRLSARRKMIRRGEGGVPDEPSSTPGAEEAVARVGRRCVSVGHKHCTQSGMATTVPEAGACVFSSRRPC
jgi:hypothetical protein